MFDRRTVLLTSCALALLGAARAMAQSAPGAQFARGPKKRILVSTFTTVTAFDTAFGGPEAGAALAAQLATLLEQTGQFDVVERVDLDSVMKEQGLLATGGKLADVGQHAAEALGAQIVVHGFVSTFSAAAKSSGFSIGFGNPDFNNNNGSIGTATSKGVIGIELKLVDVTTAKLIGATHLEDQFQTKTKSLNLTGTVSGSRTSGENPVLGEVTQGVLKKAVAFIAEELDGLAWSGHVVDVAGDDVYINVGGATGAQVGDVFAISRIVRRITDDQSGELLGVIEAPVGRVRTTDVRDKFSIAAKIGDADVQKDDVARYLPGGA